MWLHAVSVGEVASLLPLLRLLRERLPGVPIYLSTSTLAGRQMAERQAAELVDGIFFLPFDFGSCVRRAFRAIRPALLVIVETEIWPNLFATAHDAGASLALINGRISDRTWPTYRRWRFLFSSLLQLPDLIQVQSETDYRRYAELGSPDSTMRVEANLKYDTMPSDLPPEVPTFGAQQVWICASTVGPNERGSLTEHAVDEDDLALATFQELAREFPQLLLILAPRQPARFDEVAGKLGTLGLNYQRRSVPAGKLQLPGVLLLDTMGELAHTYALAQVVFVGGSIAPRGGHNIIEPSAAGAPVIIGPHMQNFEAIARNFLEAEAVLQVKDGAGLTAAVRRLLIDADEASRIGGRARELVNRQRGASQRALDRLIPLSMLRIFRNPHSLPVEIALNRLAWFWQAGGIYKRRRGERYAASKRPLAVPVVSVGGLGIGGAGKTPFTLALARLLRTQGASPGILTRGYKRRSSKQIIAAPGARLSPADTGDEAQIFLRAGDAPVGIGANRYETGNLLLEQFPETSILLLDDGFQHARIRRDVDVVLIDGLDPFGGGRVVPSGRLREPLSALSRAQIVVVTRCDSDARFAAIAREVRVYNPQLAVFRTDTLTQPWRSVRTGQVMSLPGVCKAAAFCGLGNPQSFWTTLSSLSIETVYRKAFRDHHRYTRSDLAALARAANHTGADVLLTTEKDFFNLPEEWPDIEILYLPIQFAIREEDSFLKRIRDYVSSAPIQRT